MMYNIKEGYNNKIVKQNIMVHKHSAALNCETLNSATLNSATLETGTFNIKKYNIK